MSEQSDGAPKWARWLWEADTTGASHEGAGLSVGKVVHAGIELADAEGLDGVTVRKLAQRLGVSTMAAYRHIDSRDDVVAAMVDVGLGAPPAAGSGGTPVTKGDGAAGEPPAAEDSAWESGVRRWAGAIRDRYAAHPWLLDAPIGGMPTTPNRLRWMEAIVDVLAGGGLEFQEQLDAALLIDGHVRTMAALDRSLAGGSDPSVPTAAPSWLAGYLATEGLTSMSRVFAAGALDDGEEWDTEYGIDRIIAGIRAGLVPADRD